MNGKIIAIILATAVATAAAVVFVLQKQNSKRKMRFDSSEFDDDDFMDDIACPEQCSFSDDGSEIAGEAPLNETAEAAPAEEAAPEKPEDAEE